MVTLCFLNWEKKNVATAFEGSQTSIEYLQKWVVTEMRIPYFLNLKMRLIQSACVYVWVDVWYTCVHICIIYIHSIYYIYLYQFCGGCCGDQPQYICNSFHHPGLSFVRFRTRRPCKPSEVTFRMRERGEGGMGNSLILMKSHVCVIGWLRFGSMLNCEKSDELKSYLQPVEKCSVRLFCVWCRIWQSTNCSLIWGWFSFGKLL